MYFGVGLSIGRTFEYEWNVTDGFQTSGSRSEEFD